MLRDYVDLKLTRKLMKNPRLADLYWFGMSLIERVTKKILKRQIERM